ncbi:MAG: 30S ribosome-binding factor RbfA [Candidatus Hydrogenedentota bacterium]
MAGWRMERVNQLILEEVAAVIQNDLRDPAIGFVTVLTVDTAPDLKNCTVYISQMGNEEERKASVEALNKAAAFVRRAIMPRLELRIVPALVFKLDETVERAARISALLKPGARVEGDLD